MPPAYEFRGNGNNHRRLHPKHEFTFRYPRPFGTAERPLLRTKTEITTEVLIGSKPGEEKPAMKFASVDDLSDSDEAEMDVSSDDEDDASHPRKKRILETGTAAPVSVLKWSNPDPYTVLPPPDESRAKKVDVVKLIRKARIEANQTKPAEEDAVVSNEDFISFGAVEEPVQNHAPENAPRGPKRHLEGKDPALGNRKRTHDDEIKGYSKKTGKPLSKFYTDGSIIDQWRTRANETGTPWLTVTELTLHLGTRSVCFSRLQRFTLSFRSNGWQVTQ